MVHKEADDRRYQVIDVRNKKMSTETYRQVKRQWNDGGKEALYYLLTSAEIQNQIQDFDFEANMVSTKAGVQQMIQSEPILGWFHEILDNGGHYVWSLEKSIHEWKINEDNHFSTDKDVIYRSYLKYMETQGGKNWTGGIPQLSSKLSRLHDKKIIFFQTSRDSKTKGNPTVWSFESIYAARKRWDKHLNDGEDSFHSV